MASTSGGSKSYALWHSLAIALDGQGAPALDLTQARLQPAFQSDAGGADKLALGGFERLIHLLEVPPEAYLDFESGGAGLFTVRLVDASGSTAGNRPRSAMDRSRAMVASRCANTEDGAGSV